MQKTGLDISLMKDSAVLLTEALRGAVSIKAIPWGGKGWRVEVHCEEITASLCSILDIWTGHSQDPACGSRRWRRQRPV